VHAANPEVLVILSGLNFDTDLSFMKEGAVKLSFNEKLVLELHWYSFSEGQPRASRNANQMCGEVTANVMRRAGFLLGQGLPLFVSEFGLDLRGLDANDNTYLNCFMAFAAQFDLDWALWTLGGSYYIRQGVVGMNEYYGVLNSDWSEVRNLSFLQRISAIQIPFQGITKSQTIIVIFRFSFSKPYSVTYFRARFIRSKTIQSDFSPFDRFLHLKKITG